MSIVINGNVINSQVGTDKSYINGVIRFYSSKNIINGVPAIIIDKIRGGYRLIEQFHGYSGKLLLELINGNVFVICDGGLTRKQISVRIRKIYDEISKIREIG